MTKKQIESVARALAKACYHGILFMRVNYLDFRGSDSTDADDERQVRRYADANWKRWVVAAKAALSMKADDPIRPFPDYAKVGTLALRHLSGGIYYRDAGHWSVRAAWKGGKLVCLRSRGKCAHLSGSELTACDKKNWLKDNGKYVPEWAR